MLTFNEDRAGYINVYEGDNWRGSICENVFSPADDHSLTSEELTQISDYINHFKIQINRLHRVELSNKQILLIEESDGCLLIATEMENFPNIVESYICEIAHDGIKVYPTRGDVVSSLLKEINKPVVF